MYRANYRYAANVQAQLQDSVKHYSFTIFDSEYVEQDVRVKVVVAEEIYWTIRSPGTCDYLLGAANLSASP